MIFDALSNAVYRMSLHGPGAELDGGGVFKHPFARRVRHRAAARRGLRGQLGYHWTPNVPRIRLVFVPQLYLN